MSDIATVAPEPDRREGRIPDGFGVAWDDDTVHFDDGRVVVGGLPRRLVRLGVGARRALERLTRSEPLPVPTVTWDRMVRPLLDAGLLQPVPGVATLDLSDVTVVVPVHDRWSALLRLLPTLDGVARVIVVDDGSTDSSGEVAQALGAVVVRRSYPGGPAVARNTGLELVTTPLVAFVDSDMRLESGWQDGLLSHLNDPTVALVAPRVVGDVAERSDRLARYEAARSAQDLGPHRGYVRPRNRTPFLPAAILLARTDVLQQMGGFDEEMQVGEDVDLVWRLGDAGWRVRYEPRSVVYHDARPSLPTLLRRRADYGTSAAALHRRHPGKVAPISLSPWSAAVWAAALAGQFSLAAIIAGGSSFRLGRSLKGLVRDRWQVSRLLAVHGHAGTARLLASAVSRTWLPLAALAMWRLPRTRPALLGALLVPPLAAWRRDRPPLGLATYAALHLADDAAYCAGVWIGCARHRTIGPLIPRIYRQAPVLPGPNQARTPPEPRAPDPDQRRLSHAR